jgi:uncharacterized protein YbjT (DUF2867 family)
MPGSIANGAQRRVLVLGAYGLLGSAIARRLLTDGCHVVGLGRNRRTARRVLPDIEWLIHDLSDLCEEKNWGPLLENVDVVVNCAGALQQGPNDDLDVVHYLAIRALVLGCKTSGIDMVQISAVGARENASTSFLRTKFSGDAFIRDSGIRYWIFRPGLVLAPTAYGGSALLRILAAFPLLQPLACPDAVMQTVALSDVTKAVLMVVRNEIAAQTECDLVEEVPHSLRDVVAAQRNWLGFAPAKREIIMPGLMLRITSKLADLLGGLGWRSPLRSTAVQVLSEGILGSGTKWVEIGGAKLSSLDETFNNIPATVEDRLFARIALLMPFIIGVLFVFWLVSGIVGLLKVNEAAEVLEEAGWAQDWAIASVVFWSVADIAIAMGLIIRKYAARACWAMIIVSIFYIVSATIMVPHLWSDPLGPMIKVLPSIVLALVARAALETR